jgi:hypothetical protein
MEVQRITWEPQNVSRLQICLQPHQPREFGVPAQVGIDGVHTGSPPQDVPLPVGVQGWQVLRRIEHQALAALDLGEEGSGGVEMQGGDCPGGAEEHAGYLGDLQPAWGESWSPAWSAWSACDMSWSWNLSGILSPEEQQSERARERKGERSRVRFPKQDSVFTQTLMGDSTQGTCANPGGHTHIRKNLGGK